MNQLFHEDFVIILSFEEGNKRKKERSCKAEEPDFTLPKPPSCLRTPCVDMENSDTTLREERRRTPVQSTAMPYVFNA